MYSSGYSHVSKYSQEARKKMKHRSKGKSCGYYMRIVFFFSSLIQSLIIVSLVLFLIYGKDQDSASTSRIHHLEESFSSLSIENVALKQQRKNLTTFLNATLIEKARNDWDLAKLREYTNTSVILIQDMQKRLVQCNGELMTCKMGCIRFPPPSPVDVGCNCGPLMEQMRAKLQLEKANFTQIVQRMRMDMEETAKERDKINLEAIHLRREKSTHVKEVEYFKQKCKDDFTMSLSGVSSVSSAFLQKIDSLFPTHIAFQLTCPKQREHLEQIRTNCSSLSREVEDRFQRYLNSVGDQVSSIQAESSRMKAENWRLSEDYRWCSQNRTSLIQQNRYNQDKLQLKHDQEKEKLLIDKMKLNGEIELLEHNVNYKSKEVEHLLEQIKVLNMSCMSKTGFSTFPAGTHQSRMSSPFGMGSPSQFNKLGSGSSSSFGSSGSAFNKPVSTGSGYSLLGSGSSTGFGSNKPASTGLGSSSSSGSSLLGSGSSTGFGSNKPASTGSGSSTGFGSNKPASTGSGSSSSSGSSLFGSSSSTGFGSNKPASTGSGSSSSSGSSLFGSSSSTGFGSNKPASTGSGSSSSSGSSLFGSSSSTGLGSNKPASTGSGSSSSSGSSLFGSSSSTGLGSNKPASTGSGSSSSSGSSLFGSSSSTGLGSNKPASTGSGSSSSSGSSLFGSSSSTGLGSNKPASTSKGSSSTSWFGFGGSSSGQSKTGSGTGKETSSGSGSSFGSGRTSSFGGGSVNVAQHLRDLQRLINSPTPEEKQDLSRVLG